MAVVRTLEQAQELIEKFRRLDFYAVDVETTGSFPPDWGLKCQDGARICGIGLYHPNLDSWYFPVRHRGLFDFNLPLPPIQSAFQHLFDGPGVPVAHNAGFEANAFRADGVEMGGPVVDTLFTAWLRDDSLPSFALENLATQLLGDDGAPLFKQKIEAALIANRSGDYGIIDSETLGAYCEQDCRLCWQLFEYHRPWIRENRRLWNREMRWVGALADLAWEGIPWDRDRADRLLVSHNGRMLKLLQELKSVTWPGFNPASPTQLRSYLERYNIKEDLSDLSALNRPGVRELPGVASILEYRHLQKVCSSYLRPYNRYAARSKDGRVYGTFRALTRTGRLRASRPNLQAIHSEGGGEAVRSCVRPESGWLVSADYGQAELRVAAHVVDESAMKEALTSGRSIHAETASRLGIPYEAGKRLNLGSLYGIGAERLMTETNKHYARIGSDQRMTHDQAKRHLGLHRLAYPQIQCAHRRLERQHNTGEYEHQLWSGRILHARPDDEPYKLLDYIVQASVAEIVKDAMLNVRDYLHRERGKCAIRMILQVHDEIILECGEGEMDTHVRNIAEIMVEAARPACGDVPVVVGVKKGRSWAELDSVPSDWQKHVEIEP